MLGGFILLCLLLNKPSLKHSGWDLHWCPQAGARGDVPRGGYKSHGNGHHGQHESADIGRHAARGSGIATASMSTETLQEELAQGWAAAGRRAVLEPGQAFSPHLAASPG